MTSNGLHERMSNHIGYICFPFLHCVFLNVPSNGSHNLMHSDTGCICLAFLHCAFLNVPSERLPWRSKEPKVIIVNIYAYIIVNIYDNPSGT